MDELNEALAPFYDDAEYDAAARWGIIAAVL